MNLRLQTINKGGHAMLEKEVLQIPPAPKKGWVVPHLMVYGDMNAITQQSCNPNLPNCKPKVLGAGDDFATNISTLG